MEGIIYKATNTFNGKVYIGQTVAGLPKRRAQHLRDAKADEDNLFHFALYQNPNGFTWDVIDTFEGDREEVIHALNVAEEYHILKFRSSDTRFGYNSTRGGYSSDKFSEHIKARAMSIEGGAKPILQYAEDGNFVQEFSSLNAVAAHLGKEKINLKGILGGLHYGCQWRVKRNEYFPKKIDPYKKVTRSSGRVAVYDAEGYLRGVYASSADAERMTGASVYIRGEVSDITVCERHQREFYFFKCGDGNPPETISVRVTRKKESAKGVRVEPKRIAVYSRSGELIDICESQAAATRKYKCSPESINRWCNRTPPFVIWACCAGIKHFFQVADGNEPEKIQITIKKTREKYENKMEHRIIQYTLDGEFVKVWGNTHQAAESGADSAGLIRKCLTGKFKSPKLNYQWVYYTPDYEQNIGRTEKSKMEKASPVATRPDERIEEMDKSGRVIAVYKDTADAAEKSGFSQSYICNVLAGRIRHPKRKFRRG